MEKKVFVVLYVSVCAAYFYIFIVIFDGIFLFVFDLYTVVLRTTMYIFYLLNKKLQKIK